MIQARTRLKPCSGRSRTCRRVHYYSWYSHYTQTSTAQSDPTKSQLQKQNYIAYWKDVTKIQKKMELYLHLKSDYKTAEYLSCIKDYKLRKTLTKYRLSDHCLAIERGRQTKMAATRTEFTVLTERAGNRGTFLTAL